MLEVIVNRKGSDKDGNGIKLTKRDIYYMDTQLFKRQQIVDNIVDELARVIDIPRDTLGVVASAKGMAFGYLQVRRDKMMTSYANAPVLFEPDIKFSIEQEPKTVLIVEKEAVFRALQQAYSSLALLIPGLLLVTGRGYPCMSTMKFVHFLYKNVLTCKFFILVDYDPYGFDIALQYRLGSKLPADQGTTCCPSLCLLGIKLKDLDRYADQFTPDQSRHALNQRAIKKLERIKGKAREFDWEDLYKAADDMLAGGFCTEIESLYQQDTNKLIRYITETIN